MAIHTQRNASADRFHKSTPIVHSFLFKFIVFPLTMCPTFQGNIEYIRNGITRVDDLHEERLHG